MCAHARRPTRLLRARTHSLYHHFFDEPLFRVTIGHESSPPVKRHRGEPGHTRDASGTGTFQSRLMEVPHQCHDQCPIFRLCGMVQYSCENCDADWCASCERTSSEEKASKKARRGSAPGRRERTPTAQAEKEAPGGGQAGEPAMARARRAVRSTESPRPSAGTGDARGPPKRKPPTAEPPPDPAPFQGGSTGNVCEMCLCERLPRTPFRGLWVCVWP